MLKVLILSLATVSARRINTDTGDLAQPRTDFGSFGDGRFEHFPDRDVKDSRDVKDAGDRNVKTEFSSRSFGERHNPGNPEFHEYSSFNTHFKQHHFQHSSNGQDRNFGSKNRGFGSGFTGQSEFRNRDVDERDHRDIDSSFRQNTGGSRSHGIETLGHEFGSEIGSENKQHDFESDIKSHIHRSIGQDRGFQDSSQGFQSNFGSGQFGTHTFQGRSLEHNNHKTSDNRFDKNSNAHRTSQGYGSENGDRQTKFRDKNEEANKHTDLSNQNNRNKEEFEIISAANKQLFDSRNKENGNLKTTDHDFQQNRDTENKDPSNRNEHVQHNQNVRPKSQNTNITTERRSNSDNENSTKSRKNQEPNIRTSTENEVTSNLGPNIPDGNKNNRTSHGKEVDGDKWIWATDEEKKKKGEITVNPDVDNRTAFNGDRCPTGKIKIGNQCVDID